MVLDDFVEETINEDSHCCLKCGKEVPEHLVGCWNCGVVLDESIRNLTKKK